MVALNKSALTSRLAHSLSTLGTHQIAELFDVTSKTVQHWIDIKELAGYRLPGGERRVYMRDCVAFAKAYGLPLEVIDAWAAEKGVTKTKCPAILGIGIDERIVKALMAEAFDLSAVDNCFLAGLVVDSKAYAAFVVDLGKVPRDRAACIVEWFRIERPHALPVLIANEDGATPKNKGQEPVVWIRPFDVGKAARELRERLSK